MLSIRKIQIYFLFQSKLAVENIYDIQTRIGRKNLPYKSVSGRIH